MKKIITLLLIFSALTTYAQTYKLEQVTTIEDQNYDDPTGLIKFKNNLFFAVTKIAGGKGIIELAKISADNSFSTVMQLYSTDYGHISNYKFAIAVSGDRLFVIKHDATGRGLWHSTDGTNFQKIMDPFDGLKGENIDNLYATPNYLYYTAQTEDNGMELFSCKSSFPTVKCLHIIAGSLPAKIGKPHIFNNKLYFSALDASNGNELWSYSEADGASIIADHVLGNGDFNPKDLIVYDNKLYFTAHTNATGSELYSYDGSTISLEKNIKDGTSDSEPSNKIVIDNHLYFSAISNGGSTKLYELFEGNLTEFDFPGPGNVSPNYLVEFDNTLFGAGFMSSSGREVFFLHGQSPKMIDIDKRGSFLGGENSTPEYLTVFNNALYCIASNNGDRNVFKITNSSATPVEKLQVKSNFTISPNPATNYFTITSSDNQIEGEVQIFDLSGKVVLKQHVSTGSETINIDRLQSGLYIVSYRNGSQNFTQKLRVK
ncbi:MAG: T9SS type A sorting domain-containing protein [Marinilabiliaceae bacterium]|nr:T9SS type A sorting domain-containing protein [Marinilabiliaceae bacterium]